MCSAYSPVPAYELQMAATSCSSLARWCWCPRACWLSPEATSPTAHRSPSSDRSPVAIALADQVVRPLQYLSINPVTCPADKPANATPAGPAAASGTPEQEAGRTDSSAKPRSPTRSPATALTSSRSFIFMISCSGLGSLPTPRRPPITKTCGARIMPTPKASPPSPPVPTQSDAA